MRLTVSVKCRYSVSSSMLFITDKLSVLCKCQWVNAGLMNPIFFICLSWLSMERCTAVTSEVCDSSECFFFDSKWQVIQTTLQWATEQKYFNYVILCVLRDSERKQMYIYPHGVFLTSGLFLRSLQPVSHVHLHQDFMTAI